MAMAKKTTSRNIINRTKNKFTTPNTHIKRRANSIDTIQSLSELWNTKPYVWYISDSGEESIYKVQGLDILFDGSYKVQVRSMNDDGVFKGKIFATGLRGVTTGNIKLRIIFFQLGDRVIYTHGGVSKEGTVLSYFSDMVGGYGVTVMLEGTNKLMLTFADAYTKLKHID